MAVVTPSTLGGLLHDMWARLGTPKAMFSEASPFYKQWAKNPSNKWSGGDTAVAGDEDGIAKYGNQVGLPGAGSTDYTTAWDNPGNVTNVRWAADLREYWSAYRLNHRAQELSRGSNATLSAQAQNSYGHVRRTQNVCSIYSWGNGGGAISKLSGTGLALTGTTLQLLNINSSIFFEVGDRLQFAATDGTSGAVKAVVVTVTAKNAESGQLTITPALVGGDGVLDNDYVFFAETFGDVPDGFRSFCPTTGALAATTFRTVDRSIDVTALAGQRMVVTPGADPWSTIVKMLSRVSQSSRAMIDAIYVSTQAWETLINAARPVSLTFEKGCCSVRDNANSLQYGVEGGMRVTFSNRASANLYVDPYLVDIEVTRENDLTYAGTYMAGNDWQMMTTISGINWWNADANGPLYQILGQPLVGAAYGFFGNSFHYRVVDNIIASPSVVL